METPDNWAVGARRTAPEGPRIESWFDDRLMAWPAASAGADWLVRRRDPSAATRAKKVFVVPVMPVIQMLFWGSSWR